VGLMLEGGDAIRQAREEIERYGIAVSDIDAAKIEEANDQIDRAKSVVTGLGNQIAVALAPYITALANNFLDAAGGATDFGDTVGRVIQGALRIVGKFADGLYFIQAGFMLLKAIAISALHGILVVMDATFGRGFADLVETATLGFVKIETGLLDLEDVLGATFGAMGQAWTELGAHYEKGLPSAGIEQFIRDAELAQRRLDAFRRMGITPPELAGPGGGGDDDDTDPETEAEAAAREAAAREAEALAASQRQRLQALSQGFHDEAATARQAYADRMADLREFLAAGIIEQQQFNDLRRQAEEELQADLTEIEAKANAERVANRQAVVGQWASVLGQLGNLIQDQGERQFRIAKGLAIAEALINVAQGITKALAGPFPFITAAAVAAAGAIQIAAIRRQQPNGSGGGVTPVGSGSGAGGGAATVGGEAAAMGQTYNVQINGDRFGRSHVEDLVRQIEQYNKDGGPVRLVLTRPNG
jgi:hypothetical protein